MLVGGRCILPRTHALSWAAFMKLHPRAHLLIGICDTNGACPKHGRNRATLLKELAATICWRGDYAVTRLRNVEGGSLAMLAAERRDDADRLSRVIGAQTAPLFGDWLSHRSFNFDDRATARIAAHLAATTG